MGSVEIPELGLEPFASGKVRDSFVLDDDRLLFVTSDRISAFDVVLAEAIPNKGRVLNGMSDYWYQDLQDIVANQSVDIESLQLPEALSHPHYVGRVTVARRAEMLPIECIVRGHITGSAWSEYKEKGTVHKMPAPKGMVESLAFPAPIFAPSTKAPEGEHDENISFDEAVAIVGERAEILRDLSLSLFKRMYRHAAANGITLADTKFEFGELPSGEIILCDEVGTPDSSRFWPSHLVQEGSTPPSFDKQYIRDYLTIDMGWDKKSMPPPHLDAEVVAKTAQKYEEAYERVTGWRFSSYPGAETAA